MKAGGKKLGASKTQPCTGCGNKGITAYMKGKPAAKAAFVKLGNVKPAVNKSSKKK
jgi:hypothetical protein